MRIWVRWGAEGIAAVTLLAVTILGAGAPTPPPSDGAPAVASSLAGIGQPGRLWFDTGDRAAVLAAFDAEFSAVPPLLAWNGDHDGCESGTSTPDYRQSSLDRVNYYRAMAGVPAIVTEDPTFTAKAQDAALMMSATGTLTHQPTDDFACFSATGQQAAANSNLHLGRTGPAAIDGYMEDPGAKNTDVGHRNTVLHPPTRTMGIGDVAASGDAYAANALWVFDDQVFDETSEADRPSVRESLRFVAWPPRGYVPRSLVYPRWSFTLAGADFSTAEVRLYRPLATTERREVSLTVVDRIGAEGHVPLPTIVWEPELGPAPENDEVFLIVVTGVQFFAERPAEIGDGPATATIEALSPPARPSTFAYTVRVLGSEPEIRLSPEEFLASISARPLK